MIRRNGHAPPHYKMVRRRMGVGGTVTTFIGGSELMVGRKKRVFKGYWGDDSCCLGGDEHVDGQGEGRCHQVGYQGGEWHDRGE